MRKKLRNYTASCVWFMPNCAYNSEHDVIGDSLWQSLWTWRQLCKLR